MFMNKEKDNKNLIKTHKVQTRPHTAPVFHTYKPNNEKARSKILYRGATVWNKLPAIERNMGLDEFKILKKKRLIAIYS